MEKKFAIIVVDMLNDFIYGALKCDNALKIIKPTQKLLQYARKNHIPVIFSNDAHLKGIDHELLLWGEHAIQGTKGAQVIDDLNIQDGDYIVEKRRYSGFFQTSLQILLQELKVNSLIVTGLHTHMCVRHTCADAYQYGYDLIIPQDATTSFTEKDYLNGLEYLKDVYGAKLSNVDTICTELLK